MLYYYAKISIPILMPTSRDVKSDSAGQVSTVYCVDFDSVTSRNVEKIENLLIFTYQERQFLAPL